MFVNQDDLKIFQTLPGGGWRVLIQWNLKGADDDDPKITLEPVIAWVTLRRLIAGTPDSAEVIISPLVRDTLLGELTLVDTRHTVTYLSPGEELTDQHFAELAGEYRKGVTRG